MLGPEHPDTAVSQNNLASLLPSRAHDPPFGAQSFGEKKPDYVDLIPEGSATGESEEGPDYCDCPLGIVHSASLRSPNSEVASASWFLDRNCQKLKYSSAR